jgi:uncharacterized damage-inducible protein DinB
MEINALLADFFGRVDEHVHEVLDGLSDDDLTRTVAPGSNPIGWLIWHSARVQDSHVAELLEGDQLWTSQDWGPRFGLESDPGNHGYGHQPADVEAVRPESADALREYHDAVAARTAEYLRSVTAADLDRIVDRDWDPPVTLGVRLVSIADDQIQHTGQAAYLKGLLASG